MNPAFEATATFAAPREMPATEHSVGVGVWVMNVLRSARALPPGAADRSTGLYNRAGLFAAANAVMTRRADAASMILLEFADLREVYDIYGSAIARKLVDQIVRRLRSVAGVRGLAGRTGPAQFCIVLPGASQEKAVRRLQASFGKPARIEFDAGDNEIVLVPAVLVDTAEPGAEGMQEPYRDLCRELARIQKHEDMRLSYLASERERHSRPMGVLAGR